MYDEDDSFKAIYNLVNKVNLVIFEGGAERDTHRNGSPDYTVEENRGEYGVQT